MKKINTALKVIKRLAIKYLTFSAEERKHLTYLALNQKFNSQTIPKSIPKAYYKAYKKIFRD